MTEQKKIVPKRRFKEFQNTHAWEQRKLGEISNSFEYGLNASATFFDGINKYIRITDIDDNSRLFNQSAITSPDVDLSNADNYLIKNGDILFARTGASVGKTYRYQESDGKVYYAGFLIRARINQDFDSEFVFQNTLTRKYDSFIKITSQRSGQPGVNAQEYASFDLMVPTLEEQQKIGTFFKTLEGTIALHQRKLEKTKALKSAYLSEMFPAEGECEPKRRFAGFTQAWEQRKLKTVFKDFIVPMRDKPKEFSGTVPWTRIEDIEGRFISGTTSGQYVSEETIRSMNLKIIPKGSLIVSASATFGVVAIVNSDLITNQTFIGLVPNTNYNIDFLYAFFKSKNIQKRMNRESAGSTIFYISREQFENMIGEFPILDEQEKIGEFFKQLDDIISLHQRKLEKLQNIKKAYLNEMFV